MSINGVLPLPPVLVERLSQPREMTHPIERESTLPTSGEKVSLTRLLADACSESGMQEKDTAASQGYDARYWPRIKSGEKRAYLDPVGNLPEHAQRRFLERWARQIGMHVTTEDKRRIAIARLVKVAAEALSEIA